MFTFLTGVPGAGKTVLLVDRLAYFSDWRDRPVYVDGIPGLNQDAIPHVRLPFQGTLYEYKTVEQIDDDGKKKEIFERHPETGKLTVIGEKQGLCGIQNWPYWCLPGDLIVCDEAQNYFRTRASGAKVNEERCRQLVDSGLQFNPYQASRPNL